MSKSIVGNSSKRSLEGEARYTFLFSSWVAPHIFFNRRLKTVSRKYLLGARKVYLLLTWIYYLTFNLKRQDKSKRVSFALLPPRRSKYTLTKAPMAHKTFSKEQFKFQNYLCRVTVRVHLLPAAQPQSYIQFLHSLFIVKSFFPVLETNLLFLKSCEVELEGRAACFYSLHSFCLGGLR